MTVFLSKTKILDPDLNDSFSRRPTATLGRVSGG